MTRLKAVAGVQGLQRDLVYFPPLHPDKRLVVAVAVAQPLDRFVEIVSAAIRINIERFNREIRILRV